LLCFTGAPPGDTAVLVTRCHRSAGRFGHRSRALSGDGWPVATARVRRRRRG
jgi:hypothetical protein